MIGEGKSQVGADRAGVVRIRNAIYCPHGELGTGPSAFRRAWNWVPPGSWPKTTNI